MVFSGMRRKEVTEILLENVDIEEGEIKVVTKGGDVPTKLISDEGIDAIKDHIGEESHLDAEELNSPYLFLPPGKVVNAKKKLSPVAINRIWNRICDMVNTKKRTPHSARHYVSIKVLYDPEGSVKAVQDILGHKNERHSLQYLKLSKDKYKEILNRK